MAGEPRKADFQQEFKEAGNANIIQQAGEGREGNPAPAPVPTPGERLTGSELEAEIGKPTNDHASSANTRASDPGGVRERGLTAEALRADHSGAAAAETDTEDERRDQVRARVEGLIGNPD